MQRTIQLSVLGAVLVLLGPRAHAHGSCRPVEIPSLGGSSTAVNAINDHGEAVGASATDDVVFRTHGFVWKRGRMNDLGVFPGGTHSQAFGVSNSGIVVGSADVVAGTTAVPVVWIDGQIAQLSIPADVTSGEAVGVNDSGQIVGRVNYDRCFVWDSPSAEPFEITEVDGVDCGGLLDVNNHGEIIGGGLTADRRSRAFVWKNGRGRVLDAGTDLPNTAAYDINDVGEVAGVAVRHGDDFVEMPVLWSSRGKPLILQSRHTRATSVNDRGEVAVYQAPRHTAEPSALLLFDRRQRLLTQHSVEGVAASPLYHINDRRDAVWTAWVDGLTRSFWCRLR